MSLREELIQVAAVAVAIVTDLDSGSTYLDGSKESSALRRLLSEVAGERRLQEIKWGTQHYPIEKWLAILGEEVGEVFKAALDEMIFPNGPEPS